MPRINGKAYVKEQFSEGRIALMREVNRHPELVHIIVSQGLTEWEDQLAEIAAYCFVMLDGTYLPMELDKLASDLYFKLRKLRTMVVPSKIIIQ